MKTIIILTLLIVSWQSAYCDEKYGITYYANLNNELSITLDLFKNSKYYITAQRLSEGSFQYFIGDFSMGRFIKKKDSIIFIDELSNYRFSAVFVPGYPFGQSDLEIHINNKGDFFKAVNRFACYKSDYVYYKNQLKEIKKKQKEIITKTSGKETYKFDFGDYIFLHCLNEKDIILQIIQDNTYTYSMYGAVLSEGKFNRKGDVVYLVDNNTKVEYKIAIIGDNKISAILLPLFSSWGREGKLNNEKQSERNKNKQENGFFRK